MIRPTCYDVCVCVDLSVINELTVYGARSCRGALGQRI